jgi:hypothetical protein
MVAHLPQLPAQLGRPDAPHQAAVELLDRRAHRPARLAHVGAARREGAAVRRFEGAHRPVVPLRLARGMGLDARVWRELAARL